MRPNLLRTLRFNLRAFGLKVGLRLPVYIYGRVKVYNMGRIEFHCPARRGLVKIGMNESDVPFSHTVWDNRGTIELHGRLYINHGTRLTNRGRIIFHPGIAIGSACSFDIHERLEIDHDTSLGHWCTLMDSDSHYTIDVHTRAVRRHTRPIHLGPYNWLGSHTFVKKGTLTPPYLLAAAPFCLLCKDYTALPPYTIVGGSPARPIAEGKRRIYDYQKEHSIDQYFQDPMHESFTLPPDIDLDDYCRYKR